MSTKKLYKRSVMFNTMQSMYGKGQPMTRKQALIAVLITNGIIKSADEYDWRLHRGYYSVAFSAYGNNTFYHQLEGTKSRQEDPRYLVKDTDDNGNTTYTIEGGGQTIEDNHSVPNSPSFAYARSARSFAHSTGVPVTGDTGDQTEYEKQQYIETIVNMYKDAVSKGDMRLADLFHNEIKSQF